MPTREFAATQSILTQALLKAHASSATRIRDVYLALGEIAELDPRSIQRCWEELGEGTAAEQAQLHFRLVQAEVQCMACFAKYRPQDGEIHCPHCGSYGAKVLAGEEFYLESIELDDE
jgi:hydrogenase nickel incorporation protein HypA/HybF